VVTLDDQNAGALVDGTLLLDLSLLVRLVNEAQLAFILSHEVVHVVRRHVLLGHRYEALTASHVDRMNLSRKLEAEADRTALDLLWKAGYDAHEAIPALGHLGPDPEIAVRAWRSHSEQGERLTDLRLALAARPFAEGAKREAAFQAAIDGIRLMAAARELEADRPDSALDLVGQHLRRRPESGPAYALRARIARAKDPENARSTAVLRDLETAVELAPRDADSLRALALLLRDSGEQARSNALLLRYLDARPEAVDRKIIERYLAAPPR
jgi:hypothetical protein